MDGEMLYIPINSTQEVISVPVGPQFAADPEEVLEALRAEEAPLTLWLDFVKAYLAAGHTAHAEHILREGTNTDLDDFFNAKAEGDRAVPQRVALLCAAAAFQTALGRSQRERGPRNEAFAKAGNLLARARALDHREQLPLLSQAQLALAKGDLEGAKREFERASKETCGGRQNIAPLLGLATIAFQQGRYSPALAMFRKALREDPGCPAEVRLGLAAAAFKLGRLDTARAAFSRVLQLEPSCVPALAGLAVLAMHDPPSPNRLTQALQLLARAYDIEPGNAVVLLLLAHHCLLQEDYEKATSMAKAALETADSEPIRANAEVLLARAAHAQRDFPAAYSHYRQALVADSKLPLPRYGLAQISVLQGEVTNAISLLEEALTSAPAWGDALTVLGGLYPSAPTKGQAAVAQFQEATTKTPQAAEVWHMLAELLSPTDPAGGLTACDKALELYQRRAKARPLSVGAVPAAAEPPAGPPLKLLNNAAVLHMRAGQLQSALPLMEQALQAAAGAPTAARLTVGFNMARLREASGNVQAAKREYEAMLETFPDYMDCHLRLSAIAARSGKLRDAIDYLRTALKVKPGHPDALAALGQRHFEAKEYSEAHEVFEQLQALPEGRHDLYARLGLANLFLASLPSDNHKEDVRAKRQTRLGQALRAYKDVLDRDAGNVYAANGIGAVLAEQGKLQEARDVFTEVQEAAAGTSGLLKIPDAWNNAGSAALAMHDTTAAVQIYTAALRRYHNDHDPTLLLYLARAHYDAENLEAARKCLLKALHVAPMQHLLRFNVAATMQQAAVKALRKERSAGDATKLEEFEQAVSYLDRAHAAFVHLRRLPPARSGMELKKLDAHINFCLETHSKAMMFVEEARRERAMSETRRKEQELKLQAAAAARKAQQLAKAAAVDAARKQREERAAEAREKLERLKAGWKENQAHQAAVAAGDASKIGKAKETAADADMDALFGEESGDEDFDPNAPEDPDAAGDGEDGGRQALQEAGLLSDDEPEAEDEDSEEEGEEEAAPKKAKKKKAKAGKSGKGKKAAKHGGGTPATGGRLKRLRESGPTEDSTAPMDEGLEDEAEGDDQEAGPSKRSRQAAMLEDSDNESPAGSAGGGNSAEADMAPQDGDAELEDVGEQGVAPAQGAALDNLFGSDSE